MALKILIVEDDPAIAQQLKLELHYLGYTESTISTTAEEAIEKASVLQPDILLMDVNLGAGLDGIETANHIRSNHDTCVIYLTAYTDDDTFSRAIKTEPHAYLVKPYEPIELKVSIEIARQKLSLEKQLKNSLAISQQKEREVAELLIATNSILSSNEFDVTARLIFDACKRSIGAKAGYVALLNESKDDNELLFLEDGGFRCKADPHLPMPIRGLRAEVYKSGRVAYDNDYMKSEYIKFLPPGHMEMPNVLFAPLNIDGETVGLVGLSHKPGGFTENDARLAAAFGDYAAIALKNSKTYTDLKKYNTQLNEANLTKDKFFSIISHDLRGAFNSILSATRLLSHIDELDNREIKEIASELDKLAKNQFRLLENLLEWAQLQSDSIDYVPAMINLNTIISRALNLFSKQASNKNITLTVKAAEDIPVYVDFRMIDTVLRNLVSNAIKFTHPGNTVTILAEEKSACVEIAVSDNGVGISESALQRLFRIDSQYKRNGTAGEKGTGLGLILCKEFITKNGGNIEVKSKKDSGTTFIVTLPKSH